MTLILSADRTCDLSEELMAKYNVYTIPYHVLLEEKEYFDNVDITPDDIYRMYYDKKILPKTSAINTSEYIDYFRPFVEAGHDVVHFCLGSALSSSYQNCVAAAEVLGGRVYPIDGRNLSSAVGLQVLDAGEMISAGKDGSEIQAYFDEHHCCYHGSFILDTLKFIHAGGRCSSVAALSANLLNIRPCIEVNNNDGSMAVAKKYRGSLEKVLVKYVKDKLSQYDDILTDKIFITDSGIDPSIRVLVEKTIREILPFENVIHSTASCTISCHCGPACLGILFVTKTPSR